MCPSKSLDDRDVVGRASPLHGAEEFLRRHVAVVGHVARHRDRAAFVCRLPLLDELGYARQVELVIPSCAEHTEKTLRCTPDIRPVLLVVDPGRLAAVIELELSNLLAQRLVVVASHCSRHDVRLELLDLEQIRREVARILRHQQIVHDATAGRLNLALGRGGGGMAIDVVVRQQQPVLTDRAHGVLDRGLGEVRAVTIPHELDAAAVLSCLARGRGIGVEINGAVLVGDLRDGVGNARMQSADAGSGNPRA